VDESRRVTDPDPIRGEDFAELETVPTSRADLESAGRSCMALLVMVAIILVILVVWFVLHALGLAG
jgi:hypothetical protein